MIVSHDDTTVNNREGRGAGRTLERPVPVCSEASF
jgi:hypothetical protein